MFNNLVRKDKHYRFLYNRNEYRIIKFKFILKSLLFNDLERIFFYYKFYNKKIFFYSWIRNRCIVSARGRSVLKKGYNFSRIQFKKLVSNGIFSGWSKSSW